MKLTISRRELFRLAFSAGSLAVASKIGRLGMINAFAQTSAANDYRALVCVFLFGGNDSNNMIVPLDSARYSLYGKIRGTLALSRANLTAVQTSLQGSFGIHSQLKDLQPIYDSGSLAFVANVGSLVAPLKRQDYLAQKVPVPSNLFSHADQQAQWQTSIPKGYATTGWGGRLADQVSQMKMNNAASFPVFISVSGNSILGTGATTRAGSMIPNSTPGLKGFDTSAAGKARMGALQELLTLDSGATLIQEAQRTMKNGLDDAAALNQALAGAKALPYTFPTTSIGAQLQQVAKLIQVSSQLGMNRQIFFCSLGGFDTHTNQLNDQNTLYGQLGPALAVFHQTMQSLPQGSQVTTFTESDFGRTFQPNTNGGTDHAWGSHHLVMGGAVRGKDMYGTFPVQDLGGPDDAGSEGRWIPTTSIDQYGATLAAWFGISTPALHLVFPNIYNFSPQTLAFI